MSNAMESSSPTKAKRSLASRLVLHILLWGLLYTLGAAGVHTYLWYGEEVSRIEKSIDNAAKTTTPGIASSVYTLSEDMLSFQLKAILSLDYVAYVQVTEQRGQILYKFAEGDPAAPRDVARTYPLHLHRSDKMKVELGVLLVSADISDLKSRLLRIFFNTLGTGAVGYLLMAIIIALVLRTILLRRLSPVVDYTQQLTLNGLSATPEAPFPPDDPQRLDELGILSEALKGMHSRLGEALRKQTQTQVDLKESEERFRQLVENINVVLWVRDLTEGRANYVSPMCEKIWGKPREEILADYTCILDVIHPEDREEVINSVNTIIQSGVPGTYSYRIQHPQTGARWLKSKIFPILDAQAQVCRLVGIVEDITELKNSEARQAAHVHFLETLEHVDDAIRQASGMDHLLKRIVELTLQVFDSDRAWLLYPCDPTSLTYHVPFEATKPEYPGAGVMTLKAIAGPDDKRIFAEALESKDPVTYGPGQDGPLGNDVPEKFSIKSCIAIATHPLKGKAWLFGMHQCGYARDWTEEEKRLFKEIARRLSDGLSSMLFLRDLRKSEEEYRQLVETANSIIIRLDTQGRALYFNEFAQRFFGFTKDEVLGKHIMETIVPTSDADGRDHKIMLDDILAMPEQFVDNVNENVCKNGDRVWVHWNNKAKRDQEGNLLEILSIGTDITARINAESKLRQAKEAAEDASRSKSEFLANMSHEIRTPLNGVLGMLQLLQNKALSDSHDKYIQFAIQSSKRLNHLLSDILDISRIEANRVTISAEPFDLGDTVQQSCDLFEVNAEQSGVELDCYVDPRIPPQVVGDPMRLMQVLNNLVGNAFKFTKSGAITVEAYPLPSPGMGKHKILFAVSDTGVGIPPHKIDVLFEPFVQVSEGYTRETQGAGLGLTICKQLISLMGGSISIDSAEGVGTTVHFCVTVENVETKVEITAAEPELTPLSHSRFTLLLAEDDSVNRLSISQLLETAGHSVTAVRDGQKALEAISERAFDAVLMDIQMPVLDGVAATTAIRNGEAGDDKSQTPIIALTAYAMPGDKDTFLSAGMDAYLSKPVDLADIEAVLDGLLRREAHRHHPKI